MQVHRGGGVADRVVHADGVQRGDDVRTAAGRRAGRAPARREPSRSRRRARARRAGEAAEPVPSTTARAAGRRSRTRRRTGRRPAPAPRPPGLVGALRRARCRSGSGAGAGSSPPGCRPARARRSRRRPVRARRRLRPATAAPGSGPVTASTRTGLSGRSPTRCRARARSAAPAASSTISSTSAGSPSRGSADVCRSRWIAAAAANRSRTIWSSGSGSPLRSSQTCPPPSIGVRHRRVGTPAVHPTAVGPAPQEPSGGVAQPDRALGELGGGAREGVEAQVLLHQPVEHGDHADRALGVGVEGGETEQQCPHRSTLGRRGAAGESASWRVPNHPIPAVCRLPRSCDGEHHRGWAARRGRRPRRGR